MLFTSRVARMFCGGHNDQSGLRRLTDRVKNQPHVHVVKVRTVFRLIRGSQHRSEMGLQFLTGWLWLVNIMMKLTSDLTSGISVLGMEKMRLLRVLCLPGCGTGVTVAYGRL